MNRRPLLMGALLLTLATTGWLALQPDDEQPAVAALVPPAEMRRPASAERATEPAVRRGIAQARPAAAWGTPAPGALAAWAAPAMAPVVVAASAPERVAPPRFPYTWIGRIDDGATPQALLNGPQRSFGVRAGEVLDGRWRVEAIAATRLQLTWLPTGEAVNVDAR